jgi:bacillithiol biosynthesis cysteine-adding enzyme BshC
MPNPRETTLSPGLVRRAIDFRRCPWVRPLVSAYADQFDSVRSLFVGNPAEHAAWADTIARVQPAARHRDLVSRVLAGQLERRGAPDAARQAVLTLRDPATVAIVTGQQAGAFGGPLYTLLKAVTAIQLARHIRDAHGVPVVPIFWVDAEDHDWKEISAATVLDAELRPVEVTLKPPHGAGTHPVGSLTLDASIDEAITGMESSLARTEFTADLVAALRRRYRAGAPVGTAFAEWIEDLLAGHGLVVFEANDPAVKPALSEIWRTEIAAPTRSSALVRQAGAAMARVGHPPQVDPAEDSVNLFYMDAAGRRPIKVRDGQLAIGDSVRSVADLAAEAATHPERFSPNVVLRPVVQDHLFPTICYVAGPSELAYQAQLREVYEMFGVETPLLVSRASATVLDSASIRFLERHDVAFESLQAQDESVLNQLLERQLPPSIDRLIQDTEGHVSAKARELRDAVAQIDPTLTGAVDTTGDRIRETLKNLHNKIVQASKKKDETLRRQFTRARDLAFPNGDPQERSISIVFFINRYGPAFVDRLIDELPRAANCHYLLTP